MQRDKEIAKKNDLFFRCCCIFTQAYSFKKKTVRKLNENETESEKKEDANEKKKRLTMIQTTANGKKTKGEKKATWYKHALYTQSTNDEWKMKVAEGRRQKLFGEEILF